MSGILLIQIKFDEIHTFMYSGIHNQPRSSASFCYKRKAIFFLKIALGTRLIHYKFKYSCFTSLWGKFWNPYNYCSKCIYKLIMQPAYMIENLNFTLQCLTYAYNSTDLKFSEVKPGILPQQRWSFF